MKILAISTSSSNASVSLLENDKLIKELNISDQKTHSEKLMPLIQELFTSTGYTLSNVDLIACDIGPGSFTGIRIGISIGIRIGIRIVISIVIRIRIRISTIDPTTIPTIVPTIAGRA